MDVDAEQAVEAWKLDLVLHYKFSDSAEVMKYSPSILAPRIPPNVSCVLFGWLVEERWRWAGGAGVRSWCGGKVDRGEGILEDVDIVSPACRQRSEPEGRMLSHGYSGGLVSRN